MTVKAKNSGQAVVEYLLLFAFISLIGISLVKGFTETMGKTAGGLSYILSQQLTSGVCAEACFYIGYVNQ